MRNMKYLSGFLDKLFPDDTDFFGNSWLITRIGNPEKFIEFVLLEAPEGSVWSLRDDTWLKTLDKLSQSDLDGSKLDLTEDVRKKLISLLPSLQIKDSVSAHNIQSSDGSTFFKSYDCLACVWLSKEIPEKIMSSASKKYNFDYEDQNESKT